MAVAGRAGKLRGRTHPLLVLTRTHTRQSATAPSYVLSTFAAAVLECITNPCRLPRNAHALLACAPESLSYRRRETAGAVRASVLAAWAVDRWVEKPLATLLLRLLKPAKASAPAVSGLAAGVA